MITLHATDLDGWGWYNKLDSMTKEEMVGRLLRTEPPNRKMLCGTAWHSVLENPPEELAEAQQDGIKFKIACDIEINLPQIREFRLCKQYLNINGEDVVVTGKCDGLTGNKLYDHKLTFNPNPETYLESMQWRVYMDIFSASTFQYNIYHAKEDTDGTVIIHDFSTMYVYRYPQMVEDIKSCLVEMVDFIRVHVPQMIVKKAA